MLVAYKGTININRWGGGGASHGMEGGSVADRILRGHYRKWIANKTGGGGDGCMRILQSLKWG